MMLLTIILLMMMDVYYTVDQYDNVDCDVGNIDFDCEVTLMSLMTMMDMRVDVDDRQISK